MLIGPAQPPPRSIEELMGRTLLPRLDRLDLLSRKILAGKLPGERRSKRRGQSVEFDEHRAYVPGDDLRHIDWSVYARLERLVVKLFRGDEDLALHLVVDASASMDAGDPSKRLLASRLAMALGYIGLVNQNRVLATAFGMPGPARALAPIRGRPAVRRLSAFILGLAGSSDAGARGAACSTFGDAMARVTRGSASRGIVVIISDFLLREGYEPGIRLLESGAGRGGGYDAHLLQVLSPAEIDPTARPGELVGDARLIDAENAAPLEVTISPQLVARYRAARERYVERLRRFAASRGITHAVVPSDADVGELVLRSLRARGLLG